MPLCGLVMPLNEYAGARHLRRSCCFSPIAGGRPYRAGPGPGIIECGDDNYRCGYQRGGCRSSFRNAASVFIYDIRTKSHTLHYVQVYDNSAPNNRKFAVNSSSSSSKFSPLSIASMGLRGTVSSCDMVRLKNRYPLYDQLSQ